ncbi:S8 family serine peptidase [Arachnia propionica]|uniref:Peptidase S8/S53 domain-containing protein n=1 Tax=Arachnia propionica TaxID=1750 RepID=A0A3P1WKP0_9ACTN|nr:S8 family serine peptidase [Arachnia propionica]RRD47219.1 hypothetical protein EII35_15225 [Arachnia propionica]
MRRNRPRALIALALAASLLAPAPAIADDAITDQKFATLVGMDWIRDQGLNGEGITIAYIEGAPDLTVPELQGADIEIKNPCNLVGTPETRYHSTAVASILVNPAWGWAPKAKLINYTVQTDGDNPPDDPKCKEGTISGTAIHRALDDGVDLINLSVGNVNSTVALSAALRAYHMGVPIVIAAGNTGEKDHLGEEKEFGDLNSWVVVGSSDATARRSEFSSTGDFLTVIAPGEDITTRQPDGSGNLTQIALRQGTSYATPMVTGLMALGKQKWPNATGNQLIRNLITTAHPVGDSPNDYYGYGIIQVDAFINTDPTAHEDTNPLSRRNHNPVTAEEVQNYLDGLLEPYKADDDPNYRYRGIDMRLAAMQPRTSHFGTSPRYHRK